MKKLPVILAALAALILAGCNKGDAPAAPKKEAGTSSSTTGSSGTGSDDGSTAGTSSGAPALSLDKVPQDLRHDAFVYSGLSGNSEVLLEGKTTGPDSMTLSGAAENKLIAVEDGTARFEQDWTGLLSGLLGQSELVVKSDGLYTVSMNGNTLKTPNLELPASLEKGKTWKNSGSIQFPDGRTVQQDTNSRVLGVQSVKTTAGTFDALAIEMTGTAVVAGQKQSFKTTVWYVKDLGAVKMDINSTDMSTKATRRVVLQATKVTKK